MYQVHKDRFDERYVEIPVSFTLKVYLKDDENDELPMEVNAAIVRDCIDEMEYSDIGNQVINSIVYNNQD